MKLFQIEEPSGAPAESDGPGAAVGIAVTRVDGAVAVAVGGNAEILPGDDGAPRLAAPGLVGADGACREDALAALLLALRGRAERQLARPVTHAVIAAGLDAATLSRAAAAAGLSLLRLDAREDADAVLAAAIAAEDLAPRPDEA
jgi:hypothetical protein